MTRFQPFPARARRQPSAANLAPRAPRDRPPARAIGGLKFWFTTFSRFLARATGADAASNLDRAVARIDGGFSISVFRRRRQLRGLPRRQADRALADLALP